MLEKIKTDVDIARIGTDIPENNISLIIFDIMMTI